MIQRGATALLIAIRKGRTAVIRLLLIHGANTDIQDNNGYHPLFVASFKGNLECVELLLDRGAQIDLPANDHFGGTALVVASEEGHVDVARLLIERGAAIDYQDKAGASPLYMASAKDHDDVVQLLLDGGARIDPPTKDEYCSSLLIACWFGHAKIVKTLINSGADVNYQTKEGAYLWTPLLLASYGNQLDILELLIQHGAQLDVKNHDGLTAFEVAKANDQQAVCDLLEKYRSKEMREEIMQGDSEKAVEEPGHSAQALPQLPPPSPQEPTTSLPEELDFVNQPSEDFFCPVTFELLLEPHLTACCGHHLSQRAVTRLKSEGKPCPICKEPDLATVLDKFHRRRVRAVQVRCPHTPRGCEWAGELGELSQHIRTCLKQHMETPVSQ